MFIFCPCVSHAKTVHLYPRGVYVRQRCLYIIRCESVASPCRCISCLQMFSVRPVGRPQCPCRAARPAACGWLVARGAFRRAATMPVSRCGTAFSGLRKSRYQGLIKPESEPDMGHIRTRQRPFRKGVAAIWASRRAITASPHFLRRHTVHRLKLGLRHAKNK